MLKLNTPTLFFLLVKWIKPDLICDVGSYDGQISLILRSMAPHSTIVATEANPACHQMMVNDHSLAEASIEIKHGAVSDFDGITSFYIAPDISEGQPSMSSSMLGPETSDEQNNCIEVPTYRLDTFIQGMENKPGSIALWIDVEGAAYSVLEGTINSREFIKIVHVEVEQKQIWPQQRTETEVVDLMKELGFVPLARGKIDIQHDIVFIEARLRERSKFTITTLLVISLFLSYLRAIVGRRAFSWISRQYRFLVAGG